MSNPPSKPWTCTKGRWLPAMRIVLPSFRIFPPTATIGSGIRGLIERDGIIGIIPVNSFLKSGWSRSRAAGVRRCLWMWRPRIWITSASWQGCAACGSGYRFRRWFGLQSVPPEIDTIADLQSWFRYWLRALFRIRRRVHPGRQLAEFFGEEPSIMNEPQEKPSSAPVDIPPAPRALHLRVRVGLLVTLFGLFVFIVGPPSRNGLTWIAVLRRVRSDCGFPGGPRHNLCRRIHQPVGVVEGHGSLHRRRYWLARGCHGYVIAVFSGMADVFGMGSQPLLSSVFWTGSSFGCS